MLQDVPPKRLHDGAESPLAEQVSQVGPGLPGEDVVSAVPRKDDPSGSGDSRDSVSRDRDCL